MNIYNKWSFYLHIDKCVFHFPRIQCLALAVIEYYLKSHTFRLFLRNYEYTRTICWGVAKQDFRQRETAQEKNNNINPTCVSKVSSVVRKNIDIFNSNRSLSIIYIKRRKIILYM